MTNTDFTEGKIVSPLLKFAGPVLFALFLQSMYGAVDLIIIGHFSSSAHVSAVATGTQIMFTITNLISALAMGMTILIAEKIGERKAEEGGRIAGTGILLFLTIGAVMTALTTTLAPYLASIMNAPTEAFDHTVSYIRICGAGSIVIIAYNLIGSVFRGIGDSKTPLLTVLIACICNIAGDLLLVAVMKMGTSGAAIATVFAQFVSVVISYLIIRAKELPFTFTKSSVKWDKEIVKRILMLGTPIALQDLLVGISFLIILAIVNSLGLLYSAGVGVAEKVCAFIMLIPSAFMQSMSAFVAQNRGAGKTDRAIRGLWSAIGISFISGAVMFYLAFFHGELLASLFASDSDVVIQAADYLKAYAIDCLLTCFLFCFIGFFNGMGYTRFVMIQGILGAFLVRVPVSFIMSKQLPVSLFHIGLATPCSTVFQILMCFVGYLVMKYSLANKEAKKTFE
ncbi:MAG: MATE family efflux transporter [Sphaerochaetaceae bacterium]|nr:MATE family efflux transporter [Sphaerochaetaceae bacterium]